jgi:hypothetical protein
MPCKQASLSIRALLGNLEGVRLPGLLREMNSISVPFMDPEVIQILSLGSFFLDSETIRKLSIGAIWNFVKGTGLL